MSVTTLLPIGSAYTILQNEVYALPARRCIVNTTAALQESNDVTFASSAALTDGQDTSGSFVRCTTGNAVVSFKAY